VLFGFLLPFTVRFASLSGAQRDLYLASLVLSAVATVLGARPGRLPPAGIPPGREGAAGQVRDLMAVLGLAAVGAAVLTAVFLVTSYVADRLAAGLITGLVACMPLALWFALPLTA
jgi:Family of unknown function (DUF6328)